ncbi:MAG: hypothetical protein GW815_03430 [Candidatus Moranbacteria bacterium]|nr:hypothetical protein [Candidatus Moranbacteria bacterium]OIQ03730.1 MAG: hypothetical protein AUK58_01595 [Candidatus Moranbacteria bacterium CG2_30_41_165]PIP25572.1 MAG: hypothetical protein COX32_02580 [Candidatus Moranbacteria bacterium CG23_combo_of_CG06-09_8_20_14_all_41_28]PIV85916.1 MAG: hypothetical protein COW50_04315 [Candidatus Moranbacteria bacterium CG17_big_fil_post_rev_8_21_14_2_50_41_107]PIW94468.1 MAG: hypothetical protein COZ86_00880 [Candidatus Moranbacteria bacterium CG_
MTRKVHAAAFLTTTGDQYIPLDTPSMPGIDEWLIKKEEALAVAESEDVVEIILSQHYGPVFFG